MTMGSPQLPGQHSPAPGWPIGRCNHARACPAPGGGSPRLDVAGLGSPGVSRTQRIDHREFPSKLDPVGCTLAGRQSQRDTRSPDRGRDILFKASP